MFNSESAIGQLFHDDDWEMTNYIYWFSCRSDLHPSHYLPLKKAQLVPFQFQFFNLNDGPWLLTSLIGKYRYLLTLFDRGCQDIFSSFNILIHCIFNSTLCGQSNNVALGLSFWRHVSNWIHLLGNFCQEELTFHATRNNCTYCLLVGMPQEVYCCTVALWRWQINPWTSYATFQFHS